MTVRWFRVVAAVELATLLVLLVNLATAHLPVVSSLCGPTHGCAYLVVVVATWRNPAPSTTSKVMAWLPGVGGLLVARQLAAMS